VGFEPTIPVKVYTLSKRAPSATRPSLRLGKVEQAGSNYFIAVCRAALLLFLGVDLLRQIVLYSGLLNSVELPFEPVNVHFLVVEDFLQ
jgi:hypothetical protein